MRINIPMNSGRDQCGHGLRDKFRNATVPSGGRPIANAKRRAASLFVPQRFRANFFLWEETIMLRKTGSIIALSAMLALGSTVGAFAENTKLGVVVKIGGIPWFNAMETGILAKGKELGDDASMIGPTSADPALQVRAIEDLIAQGVNAIGVVPNDANVLEPVLKKAREAGIKVIT
ncbi:MAG: substrate-binding domain-containing protein, partial [bacterium]